jgi:hypothetical protein
MPNKKNKAIFFETPKDKWKAFQNPRLVMFSGEDEVGSWDNTQSLYFYPFSWLDYLNNAGLRELYVVDSSIDTIRNALSLLKSSGKVHFEHPNIDAIKMAKDLDHKVSLICNLEELTPFHMPVLSEADFIRVRVTKQRDLTLLSGLPNEKLLSCIKVYVGEGCDYKNLAIQAKNLGFDFFYVAKRLVKDENKKLSEQERHTILGLIELDSRNFKVIIPSSLEEKFARKFVINPKFNNVTSCNFSKYRVVLNEKGYYPCYTKQMLAQEGKKEELNNPKNCLDCACIYENDMLSNIETQMTKYKSPYFALEYQHDR